MKFKVFTLFPEMFEGFISTSIIKRAIESSSIEVEMVNFRDYSTDLHNKVDDAPYGGGDGMVISPQPLSKALTSIYDSQAEMPLVVYMSPRGRRLTHQMAEKMVEEKREIAIICGHYEGIDQRFIDKYVDMEISIGDYVLTGGELPAMVLIDTISRLTGDVLGSETSHKDESFANHLLEYPHYTRPAEFQGDRVPDVLLGGNHSDIDMWRFKESLQITAIRRPDLFEKYIKNYFKTDKFYLSLTKRQKKDIEELTDSLYREYVTGI